MKSVYFIPVFNQIRELPGVLAELAASGPACDTVLLVNNGSSDGSEDLVHASGHPYIDVPRNPSCGVNAEPPWPTIVLPPSVVRTTDHTPSL